MLKYLHKMVGFLWWGFLWWYGGQGAVRLFFIIVDELVYSNHDQKKFPTMSLKYLYYS